jgi:peptidoglycan/LPS O-acetylase OafA/YrhL
LGVEEQFYFIWPLLLKLLSRKTRFLRQELLVMILLSAMSFVLGSVLVFFGFVKFAFYMLPSRLGELALGGILALVENHMREYIELRFGSSKPHTYNPLFGVVKNAVLFVPRSIWIFNVAAAVGAALIGISMGCFQKTTPFPGLAALVPCIGTCLVIAAGGPNVVVSLMLSVKPVVAIGLISYSVYLYHWPIMALMRHQGSDLQGKKKGGVHFFCFLSPF